MPAPRNAKAAVLADGYVLAGRREILGLGKDGRQRWRQAFDGDVTVAVAGPSVIAWRDNPARADWPGSLIIEAYDTTSGRKLWRDDQPSFITVLATAVYTSVCHGGQRNRMGDCRLSARDPRTGRGRWAIATYASSSVASEAADPPRGDLVAPPVPSYLLIQSFPTGYASSTFTPVDARSGRSLGASIRAMSVRQAGEYLIETDVEENRKERGCRTTFAARRARGSGALWRRTFVSEADAGGDCRGIRHTFADGELAVADASGRTALVDLATGRSSWTAGEPGVPLLVARTQVITTNADGGVTAYDPTGSVRWRTGRLEGGDVSDLRLDVHVLDRWLLVYDTGANLWCGTACPSVSLFDLASGSLYRVPPGRLITAGDGVVITELEGDGPTPEASEYHAYAIR